ncbi:MAG: hypothetical protein WCW93_03825 [Candidatus Paceibacterota bacterium]|jgi:hypothetical protein
MKPSEEIANIEKYSERSFSYFCKNILNEPIGRVHEYIAQILDTPNLKTCTIEIARGHWKTETFSVKYPVWRMWREKNKQLNISIRSNNLGISRKINWKISRLIEQNKMVAARLMPANMNHAKWSSDFIETDPGHLLFSIPYDRRSDHVDLSIVDDILSDEHGRSSVAMDQMEQTYWNTISPTINTRKGMHFIVGTPITYNDLYTRIDAQLKGDSTYRMFKFPAIVKRKGTDAPCLPERFTLDELYEIKKRTPIWSWQQEYMLEPVGHGNSLFPEELLRKCTVTDDSYFANDPYHDETAVDNPQAEYFLGGDIALSDSDRADYSVYVIVKREEGQPLKVMPYIFNGKGWTSDQLKNKLKDLNAFYKFSKAIVEQKGLSYSLVNEMTSDPDLAGVVEPFETNRVNKDKILGSLELLMRNGMLKLPNDSALIDELAKFGIKSIDGKQTYEALAGHDDHVMALAMACHAAGGFSAEPVMPVTFEVV